MHRGRQRAHGTLCTNGHRCCDASASLGEQISSGITSESRARGQPWSRRLRAHTSQRDDWPSVSGAIGDGAAAIQGRRRYTHETKPPKPCAWTSCTERYTITGPTCAKTGTHVRTPCAQRRTDHVRPGIPPAHPVRQWGCWSSAHTKQGKRHRLASSAWRGGCSSGRVGHGAAGTGTGRATPKCPAGAGRRAQWRPRTFLACRLPPLVLLLLVHSTMIWSRMNFEMVTALLSSVMPCSSPSVCTMRT